MLNITNKLAEFSSKLDFDSLPEAVKERSKILFLDLVGIMIRARDLDSTSTLIEGLNGVINLEGQCTVFGDNKKYSPYAAALINACSAHGLDLDDTHAPAQIHPGAPLIPAAFAAAEMVGASSEKLLAGIVAGYEVMARVSYGLHPILHSDKGFHLSATTGVFGAVAAAGNILGLTTSQLEHAFGTALSQTAGSGQFLVNGAWTKRFHVGTAAAGGLMAASLARSGFTGAAEALEGKHGFFNLYSPKPTPEEAIHGLGTEWEIMKVALKPYPCCRAIHAPLDAVMSLLDEHSFDYSEIDSVEVGMPRKCVDITGAPQERKRNPENPVDCQFSAHMCVAIALTYRSISFDHYPEALKDRRLYDLMQKINCYVDERAEAEYPRTFPGFIKISLSDGRVIEKYVETPLGEPQKMMTPEQIREKLESLISSKMSKEDRETLYAAVNKMGSGESLSAFSMLTYTNH